MILRIEPRLIKQMVASNEYLPNAWEAGRGGNALQEHLFANGGYERSAAVFIFEDSPFSMGPEAMRG